MLCTVASRLPFAATRHAAAAPVALPPAPRAATFLTRAHGKEQQPQQQQPQQAEKTGSELQPRQSAELAAGARGGDLMDMPALIPVPFRRMNEHMLQMQREMDSLMGAFGMPSLLSDPFDIFERATAPLVARRGGRGALLGRVVPLEVEEDDKGYTVTAEVPGFDKSEIKVSLSEDGMLTMTGSHEEGSLEGAEAKEGEAKTATPGKASARRYTSFVRSVQLPDDADRESISASTQHGVLSVRIPKTPKPAPKVREIPVA